MIMKILSRVCHLCHFVMILSNHDRNRNNRNFNFLRENIYLPSMRFLYRKSLFKNVFDQNCFICQPIFKIFAAHFATD